MTKRIISVIVVLLLTSFVLAQKADDIIGKYRLPNQLDVEIFKIEDKYFGKIIGLGDLDLEHQKDINNPDKALQGEPLLGEVIIKNLRYDKSENQWINGSMYGPEKGLIFNLKVTEVRENEIEVVGSKYFFWRTIIWEKI
ncbi:MAG: DUF2147 domain-containing protein [Candidatus Marinimicrobia bacterium]|nr:DUF2147 domain-containing protein [Candidatus Neomarinimicrobiota bacterium]